MGDKTWKAVERQIAKWFPGSRRRGADFRSDDAGKSDIIFPGWSIEVKHSKRPTFGLMTGAVEQSLTNRENPNDIPVAVIHKEGVAYGKSLVIMYLEDFSSFFINDK